MNKKNLMYLIVALLLNFACSPSIKNYEPDNNSQRKPVVQLRDENFMRIEKLLDRFVNEQKIPGLQLAISFSDSTSWAITRGTLSFNRKVELRNDHVLRTGSITKLFVAVLVLKAVEENKIQLSDSLAIWYPGIANSNKITIAEMMNHTSGLREILESFSAKMKSIFPSKNWQPTDLVKIISKQKPYFEPGTDFHYSNSNYIILGCILEQVYQKSIQQLLHEKIFSVLGLKSTMMLPADKIPENLIVGFDRDMLPWPGIYKHKTDNTAWASLAFTSGAMVSTAEELGIFTNALFDETLLTSQSLKKMTNFLSLEKADHPFWSGFGLGLTQFNIDKVEYWGHEGLFIGFESIVLYQPERKYSIALIGNVSSYHKYEIISEIQKIIIR